MQLTNNQVQTAEFLLRALLILVKFTGDSEKHPQAIKGMTAVLETLLLVAFALKLATAH